MDAAGKNTKAIKEYIATQLKQDKEMRQMSIRRFGRPVDGAQVKSAETAGRPMHAWRSVRKTGAVPENESPLAWREGCFYAIRRASPQTHSTAENALKGISRFYMSYCRPFASIGLFSVCWLPLVGCRLLVALRRFRTVNARFCIVNYRFAFSISLIFVRGDFFAASVM